MASRPLKITFRKNGNKVITQFRSRLYISKIKPTSSLFVRPKLHAHTKIAALRCPHSIL